MNTVYTTVDESLVAALRAMVGEDAQRCTDVASSDNLDLVAVIGFGGAHLRGCLGIAASSAAIRAIHPLGPDAAACRRSSEDWLAELANQLLGRAKHGLASIGRDITLSTPIVLRGLHIRVARPHTESSRCYVATTANEPMVVWVDLTAVEATEPRATPEAVAAPGDSFFF